MPAINWSGSPEELQARLAELPSALAGSAPDPGGAVRGLMTAVGLTFLGLVKEAYETKSQGGTDAMGIAWAPLSASTLALRTINSSAKTTARLKERLGKLGAGQRRQVLAHAKRLARVVGRSPEFRRERRSALRILEKKHRAGTISDRQYGAAKKRLSGTLTAQKARQEILAGAFANILRDAGRLFNSLAPTLGAPGQILNVGPGTLEVGSNVQTPSGIPLLALHNSDKPRKQKKAGGDKLPRRQVLPDNAQQIPAAWWQRMQETFQRGIASKEFMLAFLGAKAS